MRKSRSLGLIVILALAVGLAGCSAQAKESKGGYIVPQLPKTFDMSNLRLPFDSYELSFDQLARMDSDWEAALSRCAADYGATITFTSDYTRPSDPNFQKQMGWGGPLGTLTKQQASQYGYHAMPTGPTTPFTANYLDDPRNVHIEENPTPLQLLIVDGQSASARDSTSSLPVPVDKAGKTLPKGGCNAVVQSEMGGPLESDIDLEAQLDALAIKDTRVQKAITNWAACMSAAGYPYSMPYEPISSGNAYLNATEVSTAVTDVGCTTTSHWSTVYYEVLTGYEKQAIEKNPQLFQGQLASQKRALKKLEALVAQ